MRSARVNANIICVYYNYTDFCGNVHYIVFMQHNHLLMLEQITGILAIFYMIERRFSHGHDTASIF